MTDLTQIFTGWFRYAYVEIHQVRRLVFAITNSLLSFTRYNIYIIVVVLEQTSTSPNIILALC